MTEMESTLTCPECGHAELLPMPDDACLFFHPCSACAVMLKPAAGGCCVFCTYGDVVCPMKQEE